MTSYQSVTSGDDLFLSLDLKSKIFFFFILSSRHYDAAQAGSERLAFPVGRSLIYSLRGGGDRVTRGDLGRAETPSTPLVFLLVPVRP